MSAFKNATKFFHACESAKGWSECEAYVEKNAKFSAQCEPLMDINSVEAYSEWMAAIGNITAPCASYDLHASSYDNESRSAMFFATFHLKHTGEGGPVPPTHKESSSQYVYILSMSQNDKVEKLVKVWNAPWSMRELGWI